MTRTRHNLFGILSAVGCVASASGYGYAEPAHHHGSPLTSAAQAAPTPGVSFLEPFDGKPGAPQPFAQHPAYAAFDVQVHSRGVKPWASMASMHAQHGGNCSGPPTSHTTSSYDDAVFICNDHLMTAINGEEYGLIVLTPNRMFDVADGGSISFDLSTERMSKRDWWSIMITPWAENLALPLLSELSQGVDLQGAPRNTISIATDNGGGVPVLKIAQNGVVKKYPSAVPFNWGVRPGTNQAAARQPFRFTVANGRMRFERLASSTASPLLFWDVAVLPPFKMGIVQFGHHSYAPTKEGAGAPGTWHWDNLAITNRSEAGTAFTIHHVAPRQLTHAGTIAFPAAPSSAFLRFAALCRPVVNGVTSNYQPTAESHHPEHASSYFVPIPAGSTSATIDFVADGWFTPSYGCFARDFHVWAQSSSK